MIIEDPKKKKELDRVPDVDQNGDPIYKIDEAETSKESDSDKQKDEKNS